MRQLRHVDLTAAAKQHVERIDAHEHHQRADDQKRRNAEPAATAADRKLNAARKLETSAAILAAAIFDVGAFTIVLVVAHGGPIIYERVAV